MGRGVASLSLVLLLTSVAVQAAVATDYGNRSVPFDLYRGHMILVKGSIGPLDNLTLLIDTGASFCFLSRRIADELNLRGEKSQVCAYGKNVNYELVFLRELTIGPVRFRTLPSRVTDFSKLPQIGSHIDAIVGLCALMRTSFTIDYQSRVINFDRVLPFDGIADLDMSLHAPVVKVRIGDQNLRLLVDTGAKDLILYQRRLHGPIPGKKLPVTKTIYHLGAEEDLRMVRLAGVQLGASHWEKLDGFLLDAPIDCCETLDGILGLASLHLSRIHFDFELNQVSWEP